jgi:hypothetical protein
MPCLLAVESCLHNNPTAAEARLFHYISTSALRASNGEREEPARCRRYHGGQAG